MTLEALEKIQGNIHWWLQTHFLKVRLLFLSLFSRDTKKTNVGTIFHVLLHREAAGYIGITAL